MTSNSSDPEAANTTTSPKQSSDLIVEFEIAFDAPEAMPVSDVVNVQTALAATIHAIRVLHDGAEVDRPTVEVIRLQYGSKFLIAMQDMLNSPACIAAFTAIFVAALRFSIAMGNLMARHAELALQWAQLELKKTELAQEKQRPGVRARSGEVQKEAAERQRLAELQRREEEVERREVQLRQAEDALKQDASQTVTPIDQARLAAWAELEDLGKKAINVPNDTTEQMIAQLVTSFDVLAGYQNLSETEVLARRHPWMKRYEVRPKKR